MVIIESPVFTKRLQSILSDEEYRELQNVLIQTPGIGSVIPGTKGLRKLRVSTSGRGKRGGGRVIYYWLVEGEKLYMVYIYTKSETSDLTKDQLKILAEQVKEFIYER